MDRYQLLFFGGAGLLVLVQSIRGWRLGVFRQLVILAALVLAYGSAIVSGRVVAPLLHPLGYPDLVMSVAAGSVFGALVYSGLKAIGMALCRRTGEQSLGLARLGCRAGGSILGIMGALVTVWLSVSAIRFLGTVAQAEVNLARTPAARRAGVVPSTMAVELAKFKQSLDSGVTGAMLHETDPVSGRTYLILGKIAQVISNVDSMQRFVTYPGTKTLSENPRIVALQKDPEITREVARRDFLGLLGNPKIVAAVNDPGVEEMVKSFELEKALDYALASAGKAGPAKN